MTTTPSKPDLVALANYFDDIEVDENGMCKWTDVANAQTHLRAELNHLASQPSLYEAGLRDMRERCRQAALGAVTPKDAHSKRDAVHRARVSVSDSIAAAIAALPLEAQESDGLEGQT